MRHTHSDHLERWLGKEAVENVSRNMRNFYWPIAMHGCPGSVYAMPGGDFTGEIMAGQEATAMDRARDVYRRVQRNRFARMAMSRKQLGSFASLSAIITAATGGKSVYMTFQKVGVTASVTGTAEDLWTVANLPVAGAAGAAAPTGTSPTNSTTGSLGFVNAAVNANTSHFVTGNVLGSTASNTLLLYDRLFMVAKTMASTTTEAVTGTFSRYQSTTSTANNYAGGSFCFPSNPTTVLAATAHNWTVCQYTNQAGTASQSFGTGTGISACPVHNVDLSAQSWFLPLASGDVGVQALTQMQCSASVATGTIDFVVGHPIAFMPCPIANMICVVDGINTSFNLTTIFDNACLAFMEMPKPSTTACTYTGLIQSVSE